MDPASEPVGVNKAAKALGISPQQVSRGLKRGSIPNRGTAEHPKVDVEEARRARDANLSPMQRQTKKRGRPAKVKEPESVPADEYPVPKPSFYDHRSAHEKAKAEKAAIELARIRGETVLAADVSDTLFTAAREFRDALLRRWRALARELEGLSAREIESKGIAADEKALRDLVRKLQTLQIGPETDEKRQSEG